ncbi:MAG TPA: nucleotide exchange factor GrpE [Spirochaetota bacterium]|nr:nucleotide exchange factor GrpE [Spirochaetota bacterium]
MPRKVKAEQKEMSIEETTANNDEAVQEQNNTQDSTDNSCSCEETEKMEKEISAQDEEIIRLNKEIETLKDLLQRRQADFENFRKRTVKMQEEYKKLAIKDFALDILNINDDLLRAIEASDVISEENSSDASSSLIEGVKMTSKRLIDALNKYGIEEIEADNRPFDPNYHEAVEIATNPEITADTVTKVYQKGFKLEEYIVRTAKVQVTKPEPRQEEKEEVESEVN